MTDSPGAPRHLWVRAGAYVAVVIAVSNFLVLGSVERSLLAPLREAIAGAAAAVLSLLGASASADGEYVRLPGGAVQIVDSCTGLDVSLFVAAAMLLFPASWRARLAGIVLGFAILMSVNFIRVLTLAYWAGTRSAWFEVGHVYLWPAVVVVASLATLLAWLARVAPREA